MSSDRVARVTVALVMCAVVPSATPRATTLSLMIDAQTPSATGHSPDGVWQTTSDRDLPADRQRRDILGQYAVVLLNEPALREVLRRAPREDAGQPAETVVLTLPLPDGRFGRFRIEESSMLAPALAAAFPSIKTYRGAGLDDRTATARLDTTADGFHAMVIGVDGSIYIEPYHSGDAVMYISFNKADRPRDPARQPPIR